MNEQILNTVGLVRCTRTEVQPKMLALGTILIRGQLGFSGRFSFCASVTTDFLALSLSEDVIIIFELLVASSAGAFFISMKFSIIPQGRTAAKIPASS